MNRMTLRQAAEVLGISKEAVRKRFERGTIQGEHGVDGLVYVYVDASAPDGEDAPSLDSERLARLEEQVEWLKEQLEDEKRSHREADRENRRIIAGFVQRMPELEALASTPPDAAGGPETASEDAGKAAGPGDREEPERRRSWFDRLFGR